MHAQSRNEAGADRTRLPALRIPASTPWAMVLAMAAGAASILSFAPFGLWPVQLATLALLFAMVRTATLKRAALLGWAFGTGWMATGTYWLYISMHEYGGMPSWMALLAVAVLASLLGLLTAIVAAGGAWARERCLTSPAVTLLLVMPALWALSEWTRGWLFTGFPWVVSGYAHTGSPLAGYAPVIGVYGLGWLAAVIAGTLALLPAWKPLLIAAALMLAGWALTMVTWTSPHGEPISVRLLQGNIPQEMKFAPGKVAETLAQYEDMIRAAPADLIATPETALPLMSHQLPADFLERLAAFVETSGSHIAIGIPVSDGPGSYANSVLGIGPASRSAYRYDKHHLVPFGEFIPIGARWFVNMMHIPLGDFTRGTLLQAPFTVGKQLVLPNICYEDLFGEEIADQLAAAWFSGSPQATILLNVSNIAWFGDSIALPQHLQISQMRTLETGRPMLRSTNTGATAVIDAQGRVVEQLAPYTRGTLSATVQGYAGWTPYILIGNTLVVAPLFLILLMVWLRARKKRPEAPENR